MLYDSNQARPYKYRTHKIITFKTPSKTKFNGCSFNPKESKLRVRVCLHRHLWQMHSDGLIDFNVELLLLPVLHIRPSLSLNNFKVASTFSLILTPQVLLDNVFISSFSSYNVSSHLLPFHH